MNTRLFGSFERAGSGPLILVFSPRPRIRDIFSIGLIQANYRLITASSSHLAMIKANQFVPDMVILDITADNTTDILLLSRLRRSMRTRSIPVVVIVPPTIRKLIDRIQSEENATAIPDENNQFRVLEYPFNFTELLKKVKEALGADEKASNDAGQSESVSRQALDNEKFATLLFDPQINTETKLSEIEMRLQKQWVFPQTVTKALGLIESDSSCCAELAKCIKSDLTASAAILKVSNTVYYATRGGKRINDIQEAVTRLGFRETRNLLACLALIDLSPELYRSYGFSRREFWLHSLATGLIAEKLCSDCGFRNPEMAFLAGLIHDLGKIPIDVNSQTVFMHLLEETTERIASFHETESALMGFSHAGLAAHLAMKWNFPPEISAAILHHHDPERILTTPRPLDRVLQSAVYVANNLVKALFIGHSCDEIIREIPGQMLKDLHIVNGFSEKFFSIIYRSLAVFCRYLDISGKDLLVSRPHKDAPGTQIVAVCDEDTPFHPIAVALLNSGFTVRLTSKFTPEAYPDAKVVIFIAAQDTPLDVVVTEDGQAEPEQAPFLKVFLLDVIPDQSVVKQMMERNTVFIDRKRLDMHYLLYVLDRYLQRVIMPEKQNLEALEKYLAMTETRTL
jgi:putative nucleotidyltransferase with HDIG domain